MKHRRSQYYFTRTSANMDFFCYDSDYRGLQDQDVSRVKGGVIYWDKDSNLKTVKQGLFRVNEEGSMMLVNWKQCVQNITKYSSKIN